MTVNSQKIKSLRSMTSAGMLDCKQALEETAGDIEKAAVLLREKGVIKAVKKMSREASEGAIISYIHHNNKVGVLLELNCETDFVAKNEKFLFLGKNIAMHIAAMKPPYLSSEEVPQGDIDKEKAIVKEELIKADKPENMLDKILEGKIRKHFSSMILLEQPFVKEPKLSVGDLIKESITILGENIQVKKFVYYAI